MEFKIESNVIRPVRHNVGRKATSQYNFVEYPVGGSYKYPFNTDDVEEREKITRRVRTAAKAFSKTHPEYVFATWTAFGTDEQEKVENGGNGLDGIRVLRIAESKRKPIGGGGSARLTKVGVVHPSILANGHDTTSPSLV